MPDIANLAEWKEISKGLYKYILSARTCYEIHILYHNNKTDILSANARIYVVGTWIDKNGDELFERKCLLEKAPVVACLGKALEDYKENYQG